MTLIQKTLEKLGLGGTAATAKMVVAVWDSISDQAKLEIANAAVVKLKEWGALNEK